MEEAVVDHGLWTVAAPGIHEARAGEVVRVTFARGSGKSRLHSFVVEVVPPSGHTFKPPLRIEGRCAEASFTCHEAGLHALVVRMDAWVEVCECQARRWDFRILPGKASAAKSRISYLLPPPNAMLELLAFDEFENPCEDGGGPPCTRVEAFGIGATEWVHVRHIGGNAWRIGAAADPMASVAGLEVKVNGHSLPISPLWLLSTEAEPHSLVMREGEISRTRASRAVAAANSCEGRQEPPIEIRWPMMPSLLEGAQGLKTCGFEKQMAEVLDKLNACRDSLQQKIRSQDEQSQLIRDRMVLELGPTRQQLDAIRDENRLLEEQLEEMRGRLRMISKNLEAGQVDVLPVAFELEDAKSRNLKNAEWRAQLLKDHEELTKREDSVRKRMLQFHTQREALKKSLAGELSKTVEAVEKNTAALEHQEHQLSKSPLRKRNSRRDRRDRWNAGALEAQHHQWALSIMRKGALHSTNSGGIEITPEGPPAALQAQAKALNRPSEPKPPDKPSQWFLKGHYRKVRGRSVDPRPTGAHR